jgi:outer membrane PBP1 activator LpoA protein
MRRPGKIFKDRVHLSQMCSKFPLLQVYAALRKVQILRRSDENENSPDAVYVCVVRAYERYRRQLPYVQKDDAEDGDEESPGEPAACRTEIEIQALYLLLQKRLQCFALILLCRIL